MLKKERQAYILHQVNLHNKVLSASLCSEIDVSEDTIRRDLNELSVEGKIIKVYGGALSPVFNQANFSSGVYSKKNKMIIGRKAASLVQNGMFVLTGGGSTIIEMSKALPPHLHATFVSGSIPAIAQYMQHPGIDVIVIGDKLSKSSGITTGVDALNKIKTMKADYCFLGVNAIDLENGVTDNDWDVIQLKQQMISSSRKTACLTISEKINTFQPLQVCNIAKIDLLITELDPDHALLRPYAEAGITVL